MTFYVSFPFDSFACLLQDSSLRFVSPGSIDTLKQQAQNIDGVIHNFIKGIEQLATRNLLCLPKIDRDKTNKSCKLRNEWPR